VALLELWMDEDRKIAPLKALQGMIWADGYASGELTGRVYADAAAALGAWRDAGIPPVRLFLRLGSKPRNSSFGTRHSVT